MKDDYKRKVYAKQKKAHIKKAHITVGFKTEEIARISVEETKCLES
jgi:hypothetical protein